MVLKWKNHPSTRKTSFVTDPIPVEKHKEWFANTLKNPNKHLFIALLDGTEIGVLRLDVTGKTAVVHVIIAPDLRGKGLGTKAISLLCKEGEKLGMKELKARIRPDNEKSMFIFTKLGFELRSKGEAIEMAKSLSK